jgi:hypothetical protein
MSSTPRFALPFLSAGQAQKETTVNEALQVLDFVTAGAVLEPPRNDPPASASVGDCYIVGSAPTGLWAQWASSLAGYTAGGWRRIAAVPGMRVYVQSIDQWARFSAGAWELGAVRGSRLLVDGQQVVGARGAAIASTVGGANVDAEARATIDKDPRRIARARACGRLGRRHFGSAAVRLRHFGNRNGHTDACTPPSALIMYRCALVLKRT